jgi:ribA/ribD-fused uncharacterized protein
MQEFDGDILLFKNGNEIYSNFYPVTVTLEGLSFPSVEHGFQAAKTKNIFLRKKIAEIPANEAGKAKRAGRRLILRSDWDMIKISIMKYLLIQKFSVPPFKEALLNTKNCNIVEGNYWHDNYWGDCYCPKCKNKKGQNVLGKLIMKIRNEL